MSELVSEIPSDLESVARAALRSMRHARRRHRLDQFDWVDAMYRVYVTAILGTVAVVITSGLVGDGKLSPADLIKVDQHGGAAVGLLVAGALALGLRSGSRGGPIAVEAAEVRYVLLSPLRRSTALRGAALRQLRFATFLGAVIGAIGGQLAARRFDDPVIGWAAAGALTGILVALSFMGAALVASGLRMRRWQATVLAAALIAWAAADLRNQVFTPARWAGEVALWPRQFRAVDLVAVGAIVVLAAIGFWLVGRQSLEDLERRTSIVGQLRFAVTLQDFRTAMVLRRQLAQDLPRSHPWISIGRRKRWAVWYRSWRGLFRFPASRLLRLAGCSIAAALALRGAWGGTTPLALVAAAVAYIAALDVAEPLAQQVDQSDRSDAIPLERGVLLVRYLPPLALAMVLVAVPGTALVAVIEHHHIGEVIGLAAPFALAAMAGAVVSVTMGSPDVSKDGSLLPAEFAGMKIALRTAFPLLVTLAGTAPTLVAANAEPPTNTAAAAGITTFVVVAVVAMVAAWVRFGDDAKEWFTKLMEESKEVQRSKSGSKS
ncbi:MAG: hypothetical protein JWL70_2491 [Acidimicrobiia bacterium]|nr:hypothetical protein [Acidimicrobiia bacterium]